MKEAFSADGTGFVGRVVGKVSGRLAARVGVRVGETVGSCVVGVTPEEW